MESSSLISAVLLAGCLTATVRTQEPVSTFRASVDLVRVTATVQDRDGRPVRDLEAGDFEVFDYNKPQTLVDFRRESTAVSVTVTGP